MRKFISLLLLGSLISLSACSEYKTTNRAIAGLANAGSLDGPYVLSSIRVTDSSGGGSGFGFGAVSSFPGASADIGGIGIPAYIEGYWSKEDPNTKGFSDYFHISSPIDSELARQKVETLENYYEDFGRHSAAVQFVVDGPRAMLLLSLKCYTSSKECTPRENADPNNWVVKDPKGYTDVVVLFDGVGETSPTAFPESPLDKRRLGYTKIQHGNVDTYEVIDIDGSVAEGSVEMPVTVTLKWRETINPDDDWESWHYRYYQFKHTLENPEQLEANIQTYRKEAFNGYLKGSRVQTVMNGEDVGIFYFEYCWMPSDDPPCKATEDPQKRWEYIPELDQYGVVLYRGKAQQSDTPFDGKSKG
ncbi:hypothetical protein [Enterovibrio calviensis]|uniref:hypothetical protein n=1 Tax=Enterovibrio calviensis TaxID=91359 RepID=UPI0037364447